MGGVLALSSGWVWMVLDGTNCYQTVLNGTLQNYLFADKYGLEKGRGITVHKGTAESEAP